VLIPRLSTVQQATLSGTLTAAQAGMMVMDASTGKLMGWTGTIFTDITNIAAKAPLTVSATNQVAFNPGTAVGDLITWDGNNWVNMQPSAAIQHFSFTVDNRAKCCWFRDPAEFRRNKFLRGSYCKSRRSAIDLS
jgi:hypothetical protein